MKGNRALFIAIGVLAILIVGWWLLRRSGEGGGIDLLTRFNDAVKRPTPDVFSLEDVTINGETKKSIAVKAAAGTRVVFRARIPDDGWLRVNLGLKPDVWEKEGDGVRFMVLVSDGRASDELFTTDINPYANKADRKWFPTMVDLSAYAGEEIEIIFNTFASPPGREGDLRNDSAVWGAPEIVVR